MKRRVLFVLIYVLVLSALIYAKDTTSSEKKLFFSEKFKQNILFDTTNSLFNIINKDLFKFIYGEEYLLIDSRKISLKFLPSLSIKYKPNVVVEILGISAFSLDWKGEGEQRSSIPKVAFVDAGVMLAINF